MGGTNIHHTKEERNGSIHFGLLRAKQMDKKEAISYPKIQDLLLKLDGFQDATSLDFNTGYYHIELSPFSHKLCMIVLPWGKYEYHRLLMGHINTPDIF